MFRVTVDLSDLLILEQIGAKSVERATVGIGRSAAYVQAVWVSCVQGNVLPPMTRPVHNDAYAANIGRPAALVHVAPLTMDVVCTYKGARQLDEGTQVRDLKPLLLAGPHAKMGKTGPYNTVPFRHRTPTKKGAMAAPGHMQPPLPPDVYQAARAGVAIRPGTLMGQYGWRTKRVPLAAQVQAAAQGGSPGMPTVMSAPYTWSTGLYAGLTRVGDAKNSRYLTFRRVSTRSDPNSWIVPAQPPLRIVEAVHQEAARVVPGIIRAALGLPAHS